MVERDSAVLGLPTEQIIPIAANHREMVRFASINSEKFDPVKFALREVKGGRPMDPRSVRDGKNKSFLLSSYTDTDVKKRSCTLQRS